jgi:hypothetical protein
MGDLYALMKRYNCSDIKELINLRDEFSQKLKLTERGDERREKLAGELELSKKERINLRFKFLKKEMQTRQIEQNFGEGCQRA